MARFIGLFFALALSKHLLFRVTGRQKCSSSSGISGCECLFLGACDVHGKLKDNLDLAKHMPSGLEQFGHVNNPLAERNLAYLCEGLTVGILYDCNNRIPLYGVTVIRGSQFNGKSGNRPKLRFKLSKSGLQKYFQQSNNDYQEAKKRKICYFKRSFRKEVVDVAWYRAKNSGQPSDDNCIGGSGKLKTEVHRGHLVASQYGVGDQTLKKATFVYTNAVPQFAYFNSVPWQMAEGALVDWFSKNCVINGKQNAQMFIIVGVTPSTMLGPSRTPRYFGKKGFSDFQDDTNYRVNVPAEMWTAACCTFMFTADRGQSWQRGVKSTAFWRKNDPGEQRVELESVLYLERMLSQSTLSKINLFPYSAGECSKSANQVRINI